MKGQVSIIEAIIASISLFIAFSMIINVGNFQTKWKDAISSMQGKDILLTADRLGKLHSYAFSQNFKTEFIDRLGSVKDSIVKLETSDTVDNNIFVACDCTGTQLAYVQNTLQDIAINGRKIISNACSTTLPAINNCGSGEIYPDILIIWGYKDMTPYSTLLSDMIKDGNSVIEIADIPNSKVDGLGGDDDQAQKDVFGLIYSPQGDFPSNPDKFIKPLNASQISYQSYKLFYHLPYPIIGTISEAVPVEGGLSTCSSSVHGEFRFQDVDRRFWICGTTSVYWDTNENDIADIMVQPRNSFSIGNSNFHLNYIDSTSKARISFKQDYSFNDFIFASQANNKMTPRDGDKNKVLLSMGFWDSLQTTPIASVIFNGTKISKAIWIADFGRSGLSNAGDDHKQLLSSLILTGSKKTAKETVQQVSQITSYINANNTDVLELYQMKLIIGKPF